MYRGCDQRLLCAPVLAVSSSRSGKTHPDRLDLLHQPFHLSPTVRAVIHLCILRDVVLYDLDVAVVSLIRVLQAC